VAAKHGHEDLVELFLKMGANANLEDCEGRTPLHLSSHFGCAETCRRIIEAPNVNVDKKDREGMTAVHACVYTG
jgi:ankyrin repeat protein